MKKDERVYLDDIVESAELIQKYTSNATEYDFFEDTALQDAIVRRIEIIGEATKRISADFKAKHPSIPLREIAGTRDKIVHEYSGIDLSKVWKTVQEDIPLLKKEVKRILREMGS